MAESERRAILRIGDAMRLSRTKRARLRRQGLAVALLAGALGLTVALPPRPLLVWNASASAPIGLYGVTAPHDIAAGDMVIARLPAPWRALADARRYVPATVPVVKHVAAVPGHSICALGQEIFIDGRWVAGRRLADGHGRLMPWWQGCTTLRDGAVFLFSDSPASFDGRYFGPTQPGDVIGKAHPLWTKPAKDASGG